MKTKQLRRLWGEYAQRALATLPADAPVSVVVRMMNMNNRHRTQFRLEGNQIKFGPFTVLTIPVLIEENDPEYNKPLWSLVDADGKPLEFCNDGEPFNYSVKEHALASRAALSTIGE